MWFWNVIFWRFIIFKNCPLEQFCIYIECPFEELSFWTIVFLKKCPFDNFFFYRRGNHCAKSWDMHAIHAKSDKFMRNPWSILVNNKFFFYRICSFEKLLSVWRVFFWRHIHLNNCPLKNCPFEHFFFYRNCPFGQLLSILKVSFRTIVLLRIVLLKKSYLKICPFWKTDVLLNNFSTELFIEQFIN